MSFYHHSLRAAFLAAAVTATTSTAFATTSGTRVNNTVSVEFKVGTVDQDTNTASAGFVVDRKIDMQVSDTGSFTDGRPKQTDRQLIYKITNEGNDSQAFDIDVAVTSTNGDIPASMVLDTNADTLGPNEYRLYVSTDDAALDTGLDTVYDPTGFSAAATLGAYADPGTGDEFHIIIVFNIPSDAENTEDVVFSVVATALDDAGTAALTESLGNGLDTELADTSGVVDIVFADAAKTAASNGTDNAEDGKHTDNASVTVSSAELTVTKAVTIIHEDTQGLFDCTTTADPVIDDATQGAIPGACLEYTIEVANGGSANASATDISITDVIETGITFSAIMDATAWTGAAYDAPTKTISADLTNSLAANQSAVLVYRVTVD